MLQQNSGLWSTWYAFTFGSCIFWWHIPDRQMKADLVLSCPWKTLTTLQAGKFAVLCIDCHFLALKTFWEVVIYMFVQCFCSTYENHEQNCCELEALLFETISEKYRCLYILWFCFFPFIKSEICSYNSHLKNFGLKFWKSINPYRILVRIDRQFRSMKILTH